MLTFSYKQNNTDYFKQKYASILNPSFCFLHNKHIRTKIMAATNTDKFLWFFYNCERFLKQLKHLFRLEWPVITMSEILVAQSIMF
jgi:G:T-mismatch repair DNA endonuclease (very short patch repair protein)